MAQPFEEQKQGGAGFYTDTCKVTIEKNQEVLTKNCLNFVITIGVNNANFHFGSSGWSENFVSFVLPIPEQSESNISNTPIFAVLFVENGQITEFFEGEGYSQQINSPFAIATPSYTVWGMATIRTFYCHIGI